MSTAVFASIILALCGGAADLDFDCADYYNNCVINKSVVIKKENIEACKAEYSVGIKQIKALKEEN